MKKLLLMITILTTGCTTHTIVKTTYNDHDSKVITSETALYGTLSQVLKGAKTMIKFVNDEYLYERKGDLK